MLPMSLMMADEKPFKVKKQYTLVCQFKLQLFSVFYNENVLFPALYFP